MLNMDKFWDIVDAARQKPAVAAIVILAAICLLGLLVGLIKTVV